MSCELWLRRCIYERAPFADKQISQAYVFVISSFWHGFYGGYYLSFGLWFLQINLAAKVFKLSQKNSKHLFMALYESMGVAGPVILWIIVNLIFSHNGLYFQILDSYLGFLIMKQMCFIPPVIIFLSLFYLSISSKGPRKPKDT